MGDCAVRSLKFEWDSKQLPISLVPLLLSGRKNERRNASMIMYPLKFSIYSIKNRVESLFSQWKKQIDFFFSLLREIREVRNSVVSLFTSASKNRQ